MERNNKSDEIDLLDLLANVYSTFKRNLLLTLILPVAGIIVAIAIVMNSRDLYQSSLLIETSLLGQNECKFLFDQLEKVPQIPNLSEEANDKVVSISYNVLENAATATAEKSVYIEVTAKVRDRSVFNQLETALVRFINESAPVQRQRQELQRFYREVIAKIEQEIAAMDQVKQEITSRTQATYLNPSELYANTVQLYKEKTEYQIKLDEIKTVHLVKGFDSLTIDARMSLALAAVIGFLAGFVLLCILLFLKFFFGYLKQYETAH